jgi:hypothetical protein
MSVFNYLHKISYYPVPKCACTSLKTFFFELENGFRLPSFRVNGHYKHIHNFMPTRPFGEIAEFDRTEHSKFAVTRNPIERLLSCYSNRVVFHQELSEGLLSTEACQSGCIPNPSLSVFIDRFEFYQRFSRSISHHSTPMVAFLGRNPLYFSQIFPISEIDKFASTINSLLGCKIDLIHEQTGGPKIPRSVLSKSEIEKIENIYADDFEVYGEFF